MTTFNLKLPLITKQNAQPVGPRIDQLSKSLSDNQIVDNFTAMCDEMGYTVLTARVDRSNNKQPRLHVKVHPHGQPSEVREFSPNLAGRSANVVITFIYQGERYVLIRQQDKCGYLNVISVPGGHKNLLSENHLTETADRETHEEVGGIKIPNGTQIFVEKNETVSAPNAATNADKTVIYDIPEDKVKSTIDAIDPSKWGTSLLKDAVNLVNHGSASIAVKTAALHFFCPGMIEGTTSIKGEASA